MGEIDLKSNQTASRLKNRIVKWFKPAINFIYYRWLALFRIYVDPSANVSLFANLQNDGPGKICIGSYSEILSNARLATYGGDIYIGSHCSINPYVVIYGHGGVTIGDYVQIATQVTVVSANHNFDNLEVPIADQGLSKVGIHVEDDVWIGSGARILDGVILRKGCVIGANAVLTKSTIENGVYLGCPAKLLRKRAEEPAP